MSNQDYDLTGGTSTNQGRWCRFCHAAWEREHYVGSPRKDKLSAS